MTITGTNRAEKLYGTSRGDTILGLRGDDLLGGHSGNDILDGSYGDDLLKGGPGRDSLWGGRGKDFLVGGSGADDFWFDTRDSYDIVNDFGSGDVLVIDVEGGGFKGVRRGHLEIDRARGFDWLVVDDDRVAKVYGDRLHYDDILLV